MNRFTVKQLFPLIASLILVSTCIALLPLFAYAQNTSGITVPAGGASVSGDVIIQGSAVIEPFQKYELAFKREPNGDDAYSYFDGGTSQVVNGSLGIWHTAGLEAGIYSLRLRVVKLDGNYAEFYALNINVNQQGAATETPTVTTTPSEATPTPIPSATFTPGPSPTPNIGSVDQPQVVEDSLVPTDTPASVAAAVAEGPTNGQQSSSGVIVNPSNSTNGITSTTASSGIGKAIGDAMSLDRLRNEFWRGVRISAAICILGLALVAGRQIYSWSRRRFR